MTPVFPRRISGVYWRHNESEAANRAAGPGCGTVNRRHSAGNFVAALILLGANFVIVIKRANIDWRYAAEKEGGDER